MSTCSQGGADPFLLTLCMLTAMSYEPGVIRGLPRLTSQAPRIAYPLPVDPLNRGSGNKQPEQTSSARPIDADAEHRVAQKEMGEGPLALFSCGEAAQP
jgi:hypothetical protein